MTSTEAKAYGRKVKAGARAAVERGDCGTIVLNVEWALAERSVLLGIVDAHGVADVHGEIANAFREGFTGRTLTGRRA